MLSFLFGNTKYEFVSTGRYISFSTKEKIKYHKYNECDAEQLFYNDPLPMVIRKMSEYIVFSHLYQRENKSSFNINRHYQGEGWVDIQLEFPNIYWERPDGEKIEFTAYSHQGIQSASVGSEDGSDIAFMVGVDNVIEWKNEIYKGVAKTILEQMYKEGKDLDIL